MDYDQFKEGLKLQGEIDSLEAHKKNIEISEDANFLSVSYVVLGANYKEKYLELVDKRIAKIQKEFEKL